MESQSEQLEREAEETRWQLSGTLEELRGRMTPGRVVDQLIDYTRDGPAAEFLGNLGREIRENPTPLVLIGIGIAWLMVASSRTSRAAIASAADMVSRKAEDIGTATSAALSRTGEWGQQTVARLADRAVDVASTVGNKTAELAGHARDVTDRLAEKDRAASALTGVACEKAKRPLAGVPEGPHGSEHSMAPTVSDDQAVSKATHKDDASAMEPAHEHP
jgi:Protein of unknown function (DUF3618)